MAERNAADTAPDRAARFGPRSGATRQAILEAARTRFAADGYEKTTIRSIAADAGIDPSMVMRYYGSKADLFTASAEIKLEQLDLSDVPEDEIGERYIRAAVERWEGGQNHAEAILLRTAPTHEAAARRVQEIFDEQILPTLKTAFPDDPDIDVRAALFLSQGLGMVLCRYLLRLEPIASMDTEQLVQAIAASLQSHLTRPLPEAG